MNHVILVGRITGEPRIEKTKSQSMTVINLAVPRTYKNQDGIYETDFIPCILWNGIAERTYEYCKKGTTVCVRGRLQIKNERIEVIAETISFVSSDKEVEE